MGSRFDGGGGWDLESCCGLGVSIWDSGLGSVSIRVWVCSPMRSSYSCEQAARTGQRLGGGGGEGGSGGGGMGGQGSRRQKEKREAWNYLEEIAVKMQFLVFGKLFLS